MKRISILLAGLIFVFIFELFRSPSEINNTISPLSLSPVPSLTAAQATSSTSATETTSLFVPYWGLGLQKIKSDDYNQLIYFGVTVNNQGIDTTEEGYKTISKFLSLNDKNKEKFLAVRMINSKINSDVLEDKTLQQNIINQSIDVAKKQGFDGLVLDFEIASLSFQSVIDKISSFYSLYYKAAKERNLQFYITIYGDAIYKLRPYDVKILSKNADKVLIMAYDFHKARGNPGPNFPLYGKDQYGYDMTVMMSDFLKVVPKEKLVVVFGLFGYDWKVDSKKQGIDIADSFSVMQMEQKYLNNCPTQECKVVQDKESKETSVQYKDKDNVSHIVWFEDLSSVSEKKKYLQSKGIFSFAFWAYSYF